jgi:hypothetical protein
MKQSLRQIIAGPLKDLESEIERRQNAPRRAWSISKLRQLISKIITEISADELVSQQIQGYARFMAVHTAPEQPFRTALQKLLRRYRTKSLKKPEANQLLQVIRDTNSSPIYRLEEVAALREAIKQFLYHKYGPIGDKTERCFREVQKECVAIENAAAGKPVDACWFAYNLYLHDQGDTAEEVQWAHFMLANRTTLECLADIKTFAVWIREECSIAPKRKRNRPGPKKSKTERQNELQIYWEWDYRKKRNPRSLFLADYADEKQMTYSKMKDLIARCAKFVKRNGLKSPF